MGTEARIVLYASDARADDADRAADAAFARIAAWDRVLSDYRDDSEIAELARRAGDAASPVSEDLSRALGLALFFAEETDGAFDPSVGPATLLWRAARRDGSAPPASAVARARALIGFRLVEHDAAARRARLTRPGMSLDFGGIGQGLAADDALRELVNRGFAAALVEISGDFALGAPPPQREGWVIAREDGEPPLVLSSCGAAASGDAEQFVAIAGKRRSHIVDPRTAQALADSASVVVVAPDGATADALATAVSVAAEGSAAFLGRFDGARAWLRRRGESAVEILPTSRRAGRPRSRRVRPPSRDATRRAPCRRSP